MMRLRLFFTALLIGTGITAFAQDDQWKNSWSAEIGYGGAPLHARMLSGDVKEKLADHGQKIVSKSYPSFTFSAVVRYSPKWEAVLIGDISWIHARIVQYDAFGIDPKGETRYNLSNEAKPAGEIDDSWNWSISLLFRRIWNPDHKFEFYSEVGFGFAPPLIFELPFIPALTPIGMRCSFGRFYLFLENTFTPAATPVCGGLGWKF